MKDFQKVLQRLMRQSPWTKRKDWVLKFHQNGVWTSAYWWHERDGKWGEVYDDKGHRWYGTFLGRYVEGYVVVHGEVEL